MPTASGLHDNDGAPTERPRTPPRAGRQSTLHQSWAHVAASPPCRQRSSKVPRPAGTSPMKTDGVKENADAAAPNEGQGETDDTSMTSFDADVEDIRKNLEEKMDGAESVVGGNATTTPGNEGANDERESDTASNTADPPPNNQSAEAATNQESEGNNRTSSGATAEGTGASQSTPKTANAAWTPRDGTSASRKNKNKSTKSASFSSQTKFNQKTPGSSVPRKRANTSAPEAEVVVTHQFVARVTMKLPKCNSVQQMALTLLHDGLKILQTRDPSACYVKPGHNPTVSARSLAELPREFVDFYDDWSKWEDGIGMWKNTIREGKFRTVKGSLLIGCNWVPDDLLRKVSLKMAEGKAGSGGSIEFEYKENQVLNTSHNNILFGVPNNIDRASLAKTLRKLMEQAQPKLTAKNPGKYPTAQFGIEIPQFEVRRDWIKNIPWEARDEKEDLPGWAKSALQIEIATEFEYLITACLHYLKRSGIFRDYFGDFTWVSVNPGRDALAQDKNTLGIMAERHAAVQLCLGRVPLRGLLNADKKVFLHLHPDSKGNARSPVSRSIRQIMQGQKTGGIRQWQCIAMRNDGQYEGFYPNGKGCKDHEAKANEFSGALAAQLRFYCLGKGVTPESVNNLLSKTFSNQACREADGAKYVDGKVVTAGQASFHADLKRMESGWLDISKGMTRARREEYNAAQAAAEELANGKTSSHLNPNEAAAYNFQEDPSVTTMRPDDNATVYTGAGTTNTMGETIFEPPEDDTISAGTNQNSEWGDAEVANDAMEFDLTGMEKEAPAKTEEAEDSVESVTNRAETTEPPPTSTHAGTAAAEANPPSNPFGLSAEMLASFNQFQALLAAQPGGPAEAKAHHVLQNMLDAMKAQTGTPLDNTSPVEETTEFQRQAHPTRAHDQPSKETGTSENKHSEGQEGGNEASGHMPD